MVKAPTTFKHRQFQRAFYELSKLENRFIYKDFAKYLIFLNIWENTQIVKNFQVISQNCHNSKLSKFIGNMLIIMSHINPKVSQCAQKKKCLDGGLVYIIHQDIFFTLQFLL